MESWSITAQAQTGLLRARFHVWHFLKLQSILLMEKVIFSNCKFLLNII